MPRGGKRTGAGRPKKAPTKIKRIPISLEGVINLLKRLPEHTLKEVKDFIKKLSA